MARTAKVLTCALIAATVLATAVGTAGARRLGASEIFFLNHYRATSFTGGGFTVVCAVSLEGSWHSRTIEKVARSLVGYVTEVRVKRPCISGGEGWAMTAQEGRTETLPWHILYERFIGALPNITGIEYTGDNAQYLVNAAGVNCLYAATSASPTKGIVNREEGGKATALRINEAVAIPEKEGNAFCPSSGRFVGSGIVGTQITYREITITLVA